MGGHLSSLPAQAQRVLTGKSFFPHLLSAPFHSGLTVVFSVSAGLAVISAAASFAWVTEVSDRRRRAAHGVRG